MFPFDDVIMDNTNDHRSWKLYGSSEGQYVWKYLPLPVTDTVQCRKLCTWWNLNHDDVIKWKHFSSYWPFVRWINRSLVKASDAELWCFFFICPWINGWVNNSGAGDLRRRRAHCDVIVMISNILTVRHPAIKIKSHKNPSRITGPLSRAININNENNRLIRVCLITCLGTQTGKWNYIQHSIFLLT